MPEADTTSAAWSVDPQPLLSVGELSGDGAELFVQVVDAARLPGGGVVVLDAGAQELRFFDSEGRLIRVGGRAGSGPGEFRGLLRVEVLRGDTVAAWDYSRMILSLWSPAGEHLGERPARHHPTSHEGELLPDGSLLVPRYGPDDRPASGRYRPAAQLIRYADGEPQDLGSFPYEEMYAGVMDGARMPYAARSAATAGGSPLRIAVSNDNRHPQVRVYDEAGQLVDTVNLRDTREAVSSSEWEALLDSTRQRFGGGPEFERKAAGWERPDSTPAFDDLRMDDAGRIWVFTERASGVHAVVHEGERVVGEISLPQLATIYEIGSDYLLGVHRDELDVQSVKVYHYRSN